MPVSISAPQPSPFLEADATAAPLSANPQSVATPIDTFETMPSSSPPTSVTAKQRLALRQGDLRTFWNTRITQDPIARLGVAFWGTEDDLSEAMEQTGLEPWKPQLNFFTRTYLKFTAPQGVTIPPETKEELVSYWRYMGATAEKRVKSAISKELRRNGEAPTDERVKKIYKNVGLKLAKAHAEAVDLDVAKGIGTQPGLLSAKQVSDYHQEVFKSFDLPSSTYGGTPYDLIPDSLELALTSGLYARGADPLS
jgi:hypothetical protein